MWTRTISPLGAGISRTVDATQRPPVEPDQGPQPLPPDGAPPQSTNVWCVTWRGIGALPR